LLSTKRFQNAVPYSSRHTIFYLGTQKEYGTQYGTPFSLGTPFSIAEIAY
jgi:hypothetical protein